MPNIQEFDALIPNLPLAERIAMRDRLDESIDDLLSTNHEAMEQADFVLMEKRLAEYEAGLAQSSSWQTVEARIRKNLGL